RAADRLDRSYGDVAESDQCNRAAIAAAAVIGDDAAVTSAAGALRGGVVTTPAAHRIERSQDRSAIGLIVGQADPNRSLHGDLATLLGGAGPPVDHAAVAAPARDTARAAVAADHDVATDHDVGRIDHVASIGNE